MLKLLLYMLLIAWQWVLFWVVYGRVTATRPSIKAVCISLLITGLAMPVLNGYWVVLVLPFMFVQTYLSDRYQSLRLTYFYSIYTSFISLLLTNLVGLAFYLFLPDNIYNIKALQIIGIVALPLLLHWIALKAMHINFTVLGGDASYVQHDILRPANRILTVAFIIFLIVYSVETMKKSSVEVGSYTKYIFFIYIFMFFALLAFLGIQARNYLLQELKDAKAEQYEDSLPYYLEIERLYQELAGFRHDFSNIVLTLNKSIKTEDIALIKSVYNDVLAEAQTDIAHTKLNIEDLSNIPNPALKSVLSAKVLAAQQKNVTVILEVKESITDCYIDLLDYVRVISNLLDNAIEGAFNSKDRILRIALLYKDDLFVTHIENSANTETITINKMFSEGYSSKGAAHGHGLNNVQRILQKHLNTWCETSISDGWVIQTVISKKVN